MLASRHLLMLTALAFAPTRSWATEHDSGRRVSSSPLWSADDPKLRFLKTLSAADVVKELQTVARDDQDQAAADSLSSGLFEDRFSASWTLAPSGGWSAITLMNKGQLSTNGCAVAPRTCAALQLLQPYLAPTPESPEVGVRLLKLAAGAHLQPHHGPGGRLVAHLGVLVPTTATLTIAGERLHWTEGELLVFDDSVEHSVQNLGSEQPRYILQIVFPVPADQVNIETALFTLSIAADTCTVVTSLKFETPGSRTSTPVPFLSLYNKISDARASDWDACTRVQSPSPGLLDVYAAHGYGRIRLQYTAASDYIVWSINSTADWHGDPVEQHLQFGEFWTGILPNCVPTSGNCTSPTVMGKLQGPRSFGGTSSAKTVPPSAGFVSITNHSYYKFIFYAAEGDAVGLTIAPSEQVAKIWMAIGRASGVLYDNPNRFKSWLWTQGATGSTNGVFNATHWIERSLALGVELLFISNAIRIEDWHLNEVEYPNMTSIAEDVRSHGLGFGIHTLPYPPGNAPAANLVQDGIAPTYRSGHWTSPTEATGLEDMGFWWGHDNSGDIAVNGNPNGPCPQLVPGYDCSRWGSNMSLVNASWSTAGKYRAGGAISFGSGQSYGEAKHTVIWDNWGPDITLGLTIHPSEDASNGVIVSRTGSFQLAIAAGKLVWSVTTAGGQTVNVTSTRSLVAGEYYTLKLTYKSTTGQAKILFENKLDASALHPMAAVSVQPYELGVIFGGYMAPGETSLQHSWTGSMEEIYLKNISTEDREVYIYTDNVRPTSAGNVRVFDLSTAHGRTYYATVMSNILNANGVNFDTTQWDGFEILLLMPLYNFPHSAKTFGDQMYRGIPSPDWYNLGWPLAVGQDWLAAMDETHRLTNPQTAVECSFMAPGLGPWRPDMAPYVDQHGPDVVKLGLEWHPKMLFRTLLSGLVINPYHTPLAWISNEYNISYWLGGLVTTGVAPQIDDGGGGRWDAVVSGWLKDYTYYGHMQEDGAYMLHYDEGCCHIQGEACEWTACKDVMLSVLGGGTCNASVVGLYAASPQSVHVPANLTPNGTTILVFQAFGTPSVAFSVGSTSDTVLTLTAMTATEMTLSGDFFMLTHKQEVELTLYNVSSVADRRNLQLVSKGLAFPAGATGQQELELDLAIYQTAVLRKLPRQNI